jgi:hypothetical protein
MGFRRREKEKSKIHEQVWRKSEIQKIRERGRWTWKKKRIEIRFASWTRSNLTSRGRWRIRRKKY